MTFSLPSPLSLRKLRIDWGGGVRGIPEKYFLDKFSLQTMNVSLPVCSVAQLILSPIVGIQSQAATAVVTMAADMDTSLRQRSVQMHITPQG